MSAGRVREVRGGFELLFILVLATGTVACATRPIPLSAQAGSTIVIPISAGDTIIGYGGTFYTDYQRGELVYQLGGPAAAAVAS